MKQDRYNIFGRIHKGLRALLYDTAMAIQQTDFNDKEKSKFTLSQIEQALHLFDEHRKQEESMLMPYIQKHNPLLCCAFKVEYEADAQLSIQIAAAVSAWKVTENADERIALGSALFYNFNKFIARQLEHMNQEEEQLNAILWTHYTDQEIQQIQQAIIKSVSPLIVMIECKWMIRGINDQEMTLWLLAIKQAAPEAFFNSFIKMAEEALPKDRWERVFAAISDSMTVD